MKVSLIPLAIVFSLFSDAAIARGFEVLYECDSKEKTVNCRSCKEFGAGVRFMVGKGDRFVNEYYSNGTTITRERCNIVDEKNWVCESSSGMHTASMVRGGYSFVTKVGTGLIESHLCTRR